MPASELNRSIALDLDGLGAVLGGRRLLVPAFQRSYAWRLEEVNALWSDLRAALVADDPEYFLGTIVLAQEGEQRSVIDGQQRLATASLLLAAVRNAFERHDDHARASVIESDYLSARDLRSADVVPRLRLNEADDPHFRRIIFDQVYDTTDDSPASHKRLSEAMRALEDHVADEVDRSGTHWPDRLLDIVGALDSGVKLIVVSVASDADAYLIFETLNDRGLPLNIADLLKNYLFGIALESTERVQSAWADMDATIQSTADEDTIKSFIRHSWMSSHGAVRERDLYRSIKRRIRSPSEAVDLAETLARSSTSYTALIDPQSKHWIDIDLGHDLPFTVGRLGLEQFRPMALAAMEEFPLEELRTLLTQLVSWLTRGLVVGGIGGGTLERYYSDVAVAIREKRARSADEVFQMLESVIPTDDQFEAAFKSRSVNKLRLAQYLVQACEQELMGFPLPSIVSIDEDSRHSPVNILPRKADPDEWTEFDASSIGAWAHRLGNVVIVPDPLGSSVPSNPVNRIEALKAVDRPLTQAAVSSQPWTPDAIGSLQGQMAEAAVRTWPR